MSQIQINPEQVYTVNLTGNDLMAISAALQELPAKIANPLTAKIGEEVQKAQDTPAVKQLKANHKLK